MKFELPVVCVFFYGELVRKGELGVWGVKFNHKRREIQSRLTDAWIHQHVVATRSFFMLIILLMNPLFLSLQDYWADVVFLQKAEPISKTLSKAVCQSANWYYKPTVKLQIELASHHYNAISSCQPDI